MFPWYLEPMVVEGVVSALFGLIIGSFVTALVYRSPRGLPIAWTPDRKIIRSICPPCDRVLTARELIPVVSWALQGGRCACGQTKIPITYPIIEIFCMVYLVALHILFPFEWKMMTVLTYICVPWILAEFILALRHEYPGYIQRHPRWRGIWRVSALILPWLLLSKDFVHL